MQPSSGINALLSMISNAPATSGLTLNAALYGDDTPSGQAFAQLLSDFGTQDEGQAAQHSAGGALLPAGASSAITAQEIDLDTLLIQAISGDLPVTPERAAQFMPHIEARIAQSQQGSIQMAGFSQIREQLQAIVRSNAPKTLAEILKAAPASREGNISQLIIGMAQVMKKSPEEGASIEEVPSDVPAAMQSLPVTMFRPHLADNQSEMSDPPPQKKKSRDFVETITVVEPVATPLTLVVADNPAASPAPPPAPPPVNSSRLSAQSFNQAETDAAPPVNSSRLSAQSSNQVEPDAAPQVNSSPVNSSRLSAQSFNQVETDAAPQVNSSPVNSSPVNSSPVNSSPVNSSPVNSSRLSAQSFNRAETDNASPALAMPMDINQRVPPLTLDNSTQLPEVNLPELTLASPAFTTSRATAPEQKTIRLSDSSGTVPRDPVLTNNSIAGDAAISAADPVYIPQQQMTHTTVHTMQHDFKVMNSVAMAGMVNHAPVSDQVHVAIHQASRDGIERITIQLDPVDLGRVEVNMHTSRDGATQIYFIIDKPETFDSLSRDARMLERSLQEAGIKADTGSMQFNLRQQAQPQMQSGQGGQGQPHQQAPLAEAESTPTAVTGVAAAAALTRNYILNIREGVDISA